MASTGGERRGKAPRRGRGGEGGQGGGGRGKKGGGDENRTKGTQSPVPDDVSKIRSEMMPAVTDTTAYSFERSTTTGSIAGSHTGTPAIPRPNADLISHRFPLGSNETSLTEADLPPKPKGKGKISGAGFSLDQGRSDVPAITKGPKSHPDYMATLLSSAGAKLSMFGSKTETLFPEESMSQMTLQEQQPTRKNLPSKAYMDRRKKELQPSAINLFRPSEPSFNEKGEPSLGFIGIYISNLPRRLTKDQERELREAFESDGTLALTEDEHLNRRAIGVYWCKSPDHAITAYLNAASKDLEFENAEVSFYRYDESEQFAEPRD